MKVAVLIGFTIRAAVTPTAYAYYYAVRFRERLRTPILGGN